MSKDPIRIVPLHRTDEQKSELYDVSVGHAPAATPKLIYRGGHLLTGVEVYTIFWGTLWSQPLYKNIPAEINKFFDDILVGPLLDQMAEYSVPGQVIGHGKHIGTKTISPAAGHSKSVADSDLQLFLHQLIGTNVIPHPNPQTLYFLYIEPGIKIIQGGSASCQAFCGYHNNFDSTFGQIYYAAMPYPGCGGCVGPMTPLDALTSTSSHELCEAITDPVPGEGWYDDTNGEIGDICAWETKKIGTHTVQLEWSNQAGHCL